ncbi:hypothetical protein M2263_001086 [Providencia alcalifaciens]|nr:hypothetical protein [Providencia alcalifaciens]MCW2254995.1 hypothetical protein [Providencia alcalifaciens]
MIGLEIYNSFGLLQLRDDFESMCIQKKIEGSEWATEERITNPIVDTLGGSYFIAPVSQVDVPASGVGIEIFGADGGLKFSSLAKFVSFAAEYNVTFDNTGTREFRFNGKKGHRYGWIQQAGDKYLHFRNIKQYLDFFDYEYYYEADVYEEGYSYVNDHEGLTIKYHYDFVAHIDGYVTPPPSREGSGRFLRGVIVDVSMLDN